MKEKEKVNNEALAMQAVKGMQEKKARDIVLMDLRKVKNAPTDFFVICSGNSESHADAVLDSVEKEIIQATGEHPWRKEGLSGKREWVLLDYINVVVHIFSPKKREFYALEDLWADAKVVRFENQA